MTRVTRLDDARHERRGGTGVVCGAPVQEMLIEVPVTSALKTRWTLIHARRRLP